jgi:hypothetical protein
MLSCFKEEKEDVEDLTSCLNCVFCSEGIVIRNNLLNDLSSAIKILEGGK